MERNDSQSGNSGRQHADVLLLLRILQKKIKGSYNTDLSNGIEKYIIYAEFDIVHHCEHREFIDGYYYRELPGDKFEKLTKQEYLNYLKTLVTTDEPRKLKNLVDNTFALLYHIIDGADLNHITYKEAESLTAPKKSKHQSEKDFKASEVYKVWKQNKKLRDLKRKSIIKQAVIGKGATRKTLYSLVEPNNSQLSYYIEEHFRQKQVGYIWGNIKSKKRDSTYVFDKLLSSSIDEKLGSYNNKDLSPSELREIINQEYIKKLETIIGERVRGNSEKKLNEYVEQLVDILNHKPDDWIKECSALFDKTIQYYDNEVSPLSYAELLTLRAVFISEYGLYHEYKKHNPIPSDWLSHVNDIYERALHLVLIDRGRNEQYAECATKFAKWLLVTSQFEKVANYIDIIIDIYQNLAYKDIDDKHKLQYANALYYKAEYNRHIGNFGLAEELYKLSIDEIRKCPNSRHIEAERWLRLAAMHLSMVNVNAEEEFIKSISIYESIIKKNGGLYKRELALSLLCYAQYLELLEQHEKLSDVYNKAIIIYRELAESGEQDAIADLAWNLYIVGYHHYHNEQFDKAYELLNESLLLFEKLHNLYSDKYLNDISVVLVRIGNIQKDEKNNAAAEQSYLRALDYAKKASLYSEEGASYIASVLLKIAESYHVIGEHAISKKYYLESIELYKDLAQKNKSYNQEIAGIIVQMTEIDKDTLPRCLIIEKYKEAIELYNTSYGEYDARSSLSILELHKKIAILYKQENKNTQEEIELKEIVKLSERLSKWNPQFYSISYIDALRDLYLYYGNHNKIDSMLLVSSKAMKSFHCEQIVGYKALDKLVLMIKCTSLELLIDKRYNEAEIYFTNLLKVYNELKPNSVEIEKAEALSYIGHSQNWSGKLDAAICSYNKALGIFEKYQKGENIKSIADIYYELAYIYNTKEEETECINALINAFISYKKYAEEGGECKEKIEKIMNVFAVNNIEVPNK